jgi:membrane-bound lytic murein transglycosylase B
MMFCATLIAQNADSLRTSCPDSVKITDPRILYAAQLDSLRIAAVTKGISLEWLNQCIHDTLFTVHPKLDSLFSRSAEKQVDHLKEQGIDWYFERYGVRQKAEKGKVFSAENRELLERVEKAHGIDYELTLGILGMETNFAEVRFKGRYSVFNSLVSQWMFIPRRRNFALRELRALEELTCRTGRPVGYFIGSYAGASGWGQFIPSSLLSQFIDAEGDDHGLDIYALDDNLFSIDNYLYNAGLNRSTMSDSLRRYKAVYAYNHSDAYVRAVLYIYDTLHTWRQAGFPMEPPPSTEPVQPGSQPSKRR